MYATISYLESEVLKVLTVFARFMAIPIRNRSASARSGSQLTSGQMRVHSERNRDEGPGRARPRKMN